MTTSADKPTVVLHEARQELIDFAAAVRGWVADDLEAAVLAAETAGWDWDRICRKVLELVLQPDGDPAGLRHAARNPFVKETVAADTWRHGSALVREKCGYEPRTDDLGETA